MMCQTHCSIDTMLQQEQDWLLKSKHWTRALGVFQALQCNAPLRFVWTIQDKFCNHAACHTCCGLVAMLHAPSSSYALRKVVVIVCFPSVTLNAAKAYVS